MMMTTSMTQMRINPQPLSDEMVSELIETQLAVWPDACRNFERLRECARKNFDLGMLHAAAQHNPARIVSTGAKVDNASIAKRPCFLCAANRPEQQIAFQWIDGWDLLVNPFPILPVHFTVASKRHEPQNRVPADILAMAALSESLLFFFNGARAGASAPDHLHLQAVLSAELPLIRLAEELLPADRDGILFSDDEGLELPFHFAGAVITPDAEGELRFRRLLRVTGYDTEAGRLDPALVNTFFWEGADSLVRGVVVPRRAHRPSCYSLPGPDRMVISPGAIDMTGLMIVPREEDFERIDAATTARIYAEVAFADRIPQQIKDFVNAARI